MSGQYVLIERLENEIDRQKKIIRKLTYMANCFIHKDKTCSLQAQGYSEIECAELATEDSMATEMLAIINGFESRYDKAMDS